MNLQNIFNHIESEDPEFYERTSARRSVIRTFLKGAVLTSAPVVLGGLFKKAYAQSSSAAEVIDILNYALTLEYLEDEFYKTALRNASALNLVNAPLAAIQTISKHESAHVAFLTTTIKNAGGAPADKPIFDFTGGMGSNMGPFTGVFSNYPLFLALAQTFEDTGVRAYKGQAPMLVDDANSIILKAALQIHSVEARHAAHIRYMRANSNSSYVDTTAGPIRPWITAARTNIQAGSATTNAAIQQSYAGEDLVVQATVKGSVDVSKLVSSTLRASEAFDEPLTMDAVEDIIKPFVKS